MAKACAHKVRAPLGMCNITGTAHRAMSPRLGSPDGRCPANGWDVSGRAEVEEGWSKSMEATSGRGTGIGHDLRLGGLPLGHLYLVCSVWVPGFHECPRRSTGNRAPDPGSLQSCPMLSMVLEVAARHEARTLVGHLVGLVVDVDQRALLFLGLSVGFGPW